MDQLDTKAITEQDVAAGNLPNISLSPDQERARDHVCDWFQTYQRTGDADIIRFVLAGLAGTGKSTIIPFVMKALGLARNDVHFCAYTGKAAMVLQSKKLPATTMHRLIYNVDATDPNGDVEFILKDRHDPSIKDLKLIVVDEASMVGKQMQEDLESFGIPVLYVGDHGQLPPVGDDMAKLMTQPDVRLEEIHRQAADNPIIKVAMLARRNGNLPHGTYGSNVIKTINAKITDETLLKAEQVLCGKNLTRRRLNTRIRGLREDFPCYPDVPREGDKVICLRNNWNLGLVNGMVGEMAKVGKVFMRNSRGFEHPHFHDCHFTDETGYTFKKLNIDQQIFTHGKSDKWSRDVEQFDFGYAITVHKSQGSQYKDLLVFEEWLGDKSFHRLWLYTAVTRAMENLIIVQG